MIVLFLHQRVKPIQKRKLWDELSLTEKSAMMKAAISQGYYDLPTIRQKYNEFAQGGDIHIQPSHRGRLTELKERTGKTEAELYNDGNPAHKKMIVFARNARKWNHAEGGPLSDEEYYSIMEKVAGDNWRKWGYESKDAALTGILNDNTYNYRAYYDKYPYSSAVNADTHWPDEFKTAYHPTFSNESSYSGKKSEYNPLGLPGGQWAGETFIPQAWQLHANQ